MKETSSVKKKKEKIVVMLTPSELCALKKTVKSGTGTARTVMRANILMLSHKGKTNAEIIDALGCSHFMIPDVRKRYVARHSIEEAIYDAPRSGQPKKITAKHEAFVAATACTTAPKGHSHWTLGALQKELLKKYKALGSVSHERIRHILMASALKPWREKNVVHS